MKLITSIVVALICFLSAVDTHAQEGCVTVRVTDESGQAISNALVSAGFGTNIKPGWGWGGGRANIVKNYTDSNGVCVISGDGNGGEVGIAVTRDGYYGSGGFIVTFTNASGLAARKWQPWNPTVDVVLKRKTKPVSLFAVKYGGGEQKTIPELGKPIGFDLEKADWLAPYGKGENADFVIRLDSQLGGTTDDGYQLFDATFNISFSAPDDGIQSIYAKQSRGSELRLPRLAPEQGYEANLVRRAYRHIDEAHVERREDQNYFFRIRTQRDDSGNIISALYGKIHGEIDFERTGEMRFTYYLNPTPNDRNLEFDPRTNLFKNLSSLEEVREP